MFIDASAIVAILKGEPQAQGLLAALDIAKGKTFCSPIARWEAALSLAAQAARQRGLAEILPEFVTEAESLVDGLLREAGAKDIHITAGIGKTALEAAARYGKLAGHPARLNMGDCFAYACARAYHTRLLYVGNDFAQTDLA